MGPPKQASKIFKALWAGKSSRQAVVVMERCRQYVSSFLFCKIGYNAAKRDNYFKSVFK